MPLCAKCIQFCSLAVLDISIAGITDDYLHHGYLTEFLQAVDDKCFVCWRIFRNSFEKPSKARTLLWKIANDTSSDEREAEREWLSMERRLITKIYASSIGGGEKPPPDRLWPKFNADYLEALKTCHPDLVHLQPDIVAAEKLLNQGTKDDNGRASGSFHFVTRDPTCVWCP
ncbi:hypothetical protein NQ176_g8645 [Zarea fungicola]|uniref:Uncharacterized protein n=1 Tax=Zarea fungicola TaxID=93591 RepID=A0ACC1MRL5_9HYPO|nr:hypothetical protein NQ176_g8645 [Lecanicillium fungicola]